MTSHYIDITVRPDPEFSLAHLMGALISKLHRALAQRQSSDVGLSFPQHVNAPLSQRTLGGVLRLHGSAASLDALMAQPWLQGMRDHVHISALAPVPAHVMHRVVRRRQFKTNADRLRRRRMRRKGESAEQATLAIPDSVERRPELPYAHVRSSSSGQTFCLFVDHAAPQAQPVTGEFNTYGLSQGATVPWF